VPWLVGQSELGAAALLKWWDLRLASLLAHLYFKLFIDDIPISGVARKFCREAKVFFGDGITPVRFRCEVDSIFTSPRGTFGFQEGSSSSCQCVAPTTKRLKETSRAPAYHLVEGD